MIMNRIPPSPPPITPAPAPTSSTARALRRAGMVAPVPRRRAGANNPRLALVRLADLERRVDRDVENRVAALDLDRRVLPRGAAPAAAARDVAGGGGGGLLVGVGGRLRLRALDVLRRQGRGLGVAARARLVGFGFVLALLLLEAQGFGLGLLSRRVGVFAAVGVFDDVLLGGAGGLREGGGFVAAVLRGALGDGGLAAGAVGGG